MERSVRRWLYERCDFERPLADGDSRYEPIDQPNDGSVGPRGQPCADRIADSIDFKGKEAGAFFFSGLPGSGKSTELRRLAALLASDMQYWTALVDVEPLLELSAEVDLPDLLLALLFGAESQVVALERSHKVEHEGPGAIQRVIAWFEGIGVSLQSLEATGGAKAGIPGVGELTAGVKASVVLRNNPDLRVRFRGLASQRFAQFVDEIAQELRSLEARVQAIRVKPDGEARFKRLVIAVDSLEKLRGTTSNWTSVLDSAESAFRRLDEPLPLPVHVVYTVPPALVRKLNLPTLQFLPMIKLWNRLDRSVYKPGLEAVYGMIRRRVDDVYLRELLGEDSFEQRLERLVEWSAGYPRELVRLLRELIVSKDSARHFDQILSQAMNPLVEQVTTAEAVEVVAQVIHSTDIKVPEVLERILDRLLSNNVILRYQNRDRWYDVHPVLRRYPTVQEALVRLQAGAPSERA